MDRSKRQTKSPTTKTTGGTRIRRGIGARGLLRAVFLPLLAGLLILGIASPLARGAEDEVVLTQGVSLTPAANPGDPDELALDGTFDDAVGFISAHDPIHIPLASVPGLEATGVDAVTISIATDKHAIAVRGDGTLQGEPVSILLSADWNEGNAGDTSPRIVLGVEFTDVELSFLNPAWTDLGDGTSPTFSRAWITFTNVTGAMDVATLPQAAADFYELTAGNPIDLFAGANFRGFLDLNLYPALRRALAFHGVQTQEILIEGHLAATAALLYGNATGPDLGELDLAATIDTTGASHPAWLTDRELEIGLSLDPGPAITFGDTIDTLVGGAANQFHQDLSFDPADFAGPGAIEVSGSFTLTSSLEAPFGLDLVGPTLDLSVGIDLSAPSIVTSIDATLSTGINVGAGTIGAEIQLVVDGGNVGVHVTLDNDVSLGDLVDATAAALDLPDFDTSEFGDLTIDTVTFDIDRVGGNTRVSLAASLGAWNNVFGLDWLDLQDLTVSLTLADGTLGGAAFPEPRLSANLTSLFDIGGIDSTLTIDVSGIEGQLAAKIRAALAPGQVVPMGAPLARVADQFGAPPDLGSLLSDIDLDGLSMTVSVDAAASVAFDIFASVDVPSFPGASLYVSVQNPGGNLAFFAGIRPDGSVSVGDIVPIPGMENVELPDMGLVLATGDMDVDAANLTAEGFEFLKPLFGCAAGDHQPGQGGSTCNFQARLDAGVNMLANIEIPDVVDPITEALWMDPDGGLQFLGTVPFDLGGTPPDGFSLRMVLPEVNPPDQVDFIESGRLEIGTAITIPQGGSPSVSIFVGGTLETRWRRSPDPVSSPAACVDAQGDPLGTYLTGLDDDGSGTNHYVTHHYCYDRLTFKVTSEVTLSLTGVDLTLSGALQATDGLWRQPFGVDWLDIKTVVLQFTVGYDIPTTSLSFEAGFMGDIVVNDKVLATSIAVGLSITPFPPPPTPAPAALITPRFIGFRGYVSSLGMADVVELQRMFTSATNPGADPLGFDQLPDIEIRNAEVMFAIEDKPELCLEFGLGIAGEVFIDGEPAGDLDVPTDENGCREFGSLVDPESCQDSGVFGRRDEGCFASFFARVSLAGIIADGSVGALDLGPVHFDDARLRFMLTPTLQAFVLSGGVTVDGLGSGDMDVSIKKDAPQLSFYGSLTSYGFATQVDGTLSIGLTPPFNPGGHVHFHASLDAGFMSPLTDDVHDELEGIHDTLAPVLEFWNALTGDRPGGALNDIAAALAAVGEDAPDWAAPLDQAAVAARDAMNVAIDAYNLLGHDVEHVTRGDVSISVLLDGGTMHIDVGARKLECPIGQYRDGSSCYWRTDDSYAGSADPYCDAPAELYSGNDRCRISITVPSFSDFVDDLGLDDIELPVSLSGIRTELGNLLEAGIRSVTGIDVNLDIEDYLDKLVTGLEDLSSFSVDCADFTFDASADLDTGASVEIQLGLAMHLFGDDYGLGQRWTLPVPAADDLPDLFAKLLDQFLGSPDAVACHEPAELPREIVEATTETVPTLELTASPSSIDEGDQVTITGTFSAPLSSPTSVQIRWRDGSSSTVLASGSTFQASHTYLDDRPGSTADVYTVQAYIDGVLQDSVPVTVNNVAPSIAQASLDAIRDAVMVEGTQYAFTIQLSDPGVLDRHTVRVSWGDGTSDSVRSLNAGVTSTSVSHRYADNTPEGTESGPYPVTVTVSDDDTGSTSRIVQATVHNVAPSGLTLNLIPGSIPEIGVTVVTGSFTDPGLVDVHTVTIDWGNASIAPTTLVLPVGQRTFAAPAQYGDNGTFTITVRVDDGDTGVVSGQRSVVVSNVTPIMFLDKTGATDVNGTPTFITRIGSSVTLPARASDPGSDDLIFRWDFDTSTPAIDVTFTSRVPGQTGPDPAISPSVNPRLGDNRAFDTRSRSYTAACLYQVRLSVADDDGASVADTVMVVVQGLETMHRSPGYWYTQYSKKNAALSESVRTCYLAIARHMSRVFGSGADGDPIAAATFAQAASILNGESTSRAKLQRQILSSWLDFASGSFSYNQLLDTNGDGFTDTTFSSMMQTAETLALNPSATSAQLLAMKDMLARFNL